MVQREFEWKGSLVTISACDITQDLKEGKVFVSILGGNSKEVLDKLNRNKGEITSCFQAGGVKKHSCVDLSY